MTVLSASEVAQWWVKAGGPASRSVEWVAIAIAESSLDDAAVSPTNAIGLWQIEVYNAWWAHTNAGGLFNPLFNAQAAVYGSGGGTNCAPWDTCYADINSSGRYGYLSYPERGSAAWNNITGASAAIGAGGQVGATVGSAPNPVDRAANVFSALTFDVQVTIPGFVRDLQITRASTVPIYGPGWR